MSKKTEYVKSEGRASEICEQDVLEIAGMKYKVFRVSATSYGRVALRLYSVEEPNIDEFLTKLVLAEHLRVVILNEIPKKK